MVGRRATLRLLSGCNNRCLFCAQAGGAPAEVGEADVAAGLAALRSAGFDEVTFVGGEPTMHPGLVGAVRAARGAGFAAVGVQTNGRRLREGGLAADLAGAGLTDVHLSLHGLGAAHDFHAGAAGAFAEATAGLVAARGAGLAVAVNTVLTRSNARSLGELGPWLAARGAAAWCVSVPRVAGSLRAAFDPVFPRLAIALPYALHALSSARREGVAVFVRGAPACLLGPFASRSLPEEGARAFDPARCGGCVARARCAGLDPAYLARFAGDEVSRARAPADDGPAWEGRDAALARLFVGAGPLVTGAPADHAGG